jgi:DNA-directed RNA polymerase beta subunit
MCYTGYNVEDAILINEGSVSRGIFRTSYFSMYEAREEASKISGSTTNSHFSDVLTKNVVGIKPGFDYSHLDKWGLIKENTPLDDKVVLIGKVTSGTQSPSLGKAIGMGYVATDFATIGSEIYISIRNASLKAKVVKMPFA